MSESHLGRRSRLRLMIGAAVWVVAGFWLSPAWAGGACLADVDCGRGEVCLQAECRDCGAGIVGLAECRDAEFLRTDACGSYVLEQLRAAAGPCFAVCGRARFQLEMCLDPQVINSVCGTVEAEAWAADVAALTALRRDDIDAVLPDDAITSTCFRLTQGETPEHEEATVLVPAPGPAGEGCLDDTGEFVPGCLDDAGERVDVKREFYGREGHGFIGFATHYYGVRMQHMTSQSSADPALAGLLGFGFDLKRAIWEANGDRVESCEEYVYEAYYDYSQFEDAIETLGNDYWAIWDVAFRNAPAVEDPNLALQPAVRARRAKDSLGFVASRWNGLFHLMPTPHSAVGTRQMLGMPAAARNGDPIEPAIKLPSTYKANPWFRFISFAGPDPSVEDPFGECGLDLRKPTICDDDLRATLTQALANYPGANTASFAWHYQKGVALRASGVLDEELTQYAQLADELAHVRAKRASVVAEVKAVMREISGWQDVGELILPEVEVPGFDEVLSNPALLDSQIAAGRAEGLGNISAKLSSFNTNQAYAGGQVAATAAIIAAEGGLRLIGDPLNNLSFGADGPGAVPMAYYQAGPGGSSARSTERARTGGDHLADWRDDDDDGGGPLAGLALTPAGVLEARYEALLEELNDVERILEVLLGTAVEAGCYRTDAGNPCEWTPKMFAEMLLALYGEREAVYQTCQDNTANDGFAAMNGRSFGVNLEVPIDPEAARFPWTSASPRGHWPVDHRMCWLDDDGDLPRLSGYPGYTPFGIPITPAQLAPCPDCNDWSRDTTSASQYFRCLSGWKRVLLGMVEDAIPDIINEDGNAQLLDRDGEWWEVGNSDFGVFAGYGFGWAIGNFEEYVDAGGDAALRCDLAPEVYGHFDLGGAVFGSKIEVIDASGHMRYGNNPSNFPGGLPRRPDETPTVELNQIDVEFLGSTIFNADLERTNDGFNFVTGSDARAETMLSVSATFVIGFIPVTVSAGMAGVVGMSYELGGSTPAFEQPGSCTLIEAKASLSPFGSINAFASASINAGVAEAGIKIDLVLIRVDLPFSGRLALQMAPGFDVQMLATMKLDLVVSLLSGRVLLFLRLLWEEWEIELFSWDGPRFATNIFDLSAAIPLFTVAEIVSELENN